MDHVSERRGKKDDDQPEKKRRDSVGKSTPQLVEGGDKDEATPSPNRTSNTWTDPQEGVAFQVEKVDNLEGGRVHILHDGKKYIYYQRYCLYRTPEQAALWDAHARAHRNPYDRPMKSVLPSSHDIAERHEWRIRSQELSTTLHVRRPGQPRPKPQPQPGERKITTLSDLKKDDDDDEGGTPGSVSGGGKVRVGGGTTSQTVTLTLPSKAQDPAHGKGKEPSSSTESKTEDSGASKHLVLRLSASPQPAAVTNAPTEHMIEMFLQDLGEGHAWGNEAVATVLANHWGVQFTIHHEDDEGQSYSVVVGSGGPMFHILHKNRHYEAYGPDGRLVIFTGSDNGDCLFRACYRAVTGTWPTDEHIRALRRLAAQGLTIGQILNMMEALRNEAREEGLFGVGSGMRRLVLRNGARSSTSQQEPKPKEARPESQGQTLSGQPPGTTPQPSREEMRQRNVAFYAPKPAAQTTEPAAKERTPEPKPKELTPAPKELTPEPTKELSPEPTKETSPEPTRELTPEPTLSQPAPKQSVEPQPLEEPAHDGAEEIEVSVLDHMLGMRDSYRDMVTAQLAKVGAKNAERRRILEAREQRKEQRHLKLQAHKQAAARRNRQAGLNRKFALEHAQRREQEKALERKEREARDRAEAALLAGILVVLDAHPPAGTTEVDLQLFLNTHFDELTTHGFDGTQDHIVVLRRAFAVLAARAEAARQAREKRLDPENTDTWQMTPAVQFANGTNAGTIQGTMEGTNLLLNLANGTLMDRHSAPVLNTVYHQHLAGGSWGVAFMYVLNPDYTVTGWIIDLAYSRPSGENTYNWETGGTDYTPKKAKLPAYHKPEKKDDDKDKDKDDKKDKKGGRKK